MTEIKTTRRGLRQVIAQYIRDKTGDGTEIIDLVVDVMQGKIHGRKNTAITADLKLRLEAANFLADRGWGKPTQEIDLHTDEGLEAQEELQKYTTEELERMAFAAEYPPAPAKNGHKKVHA